MQDRYALRFESGERRGERIPIAAGGLTVGRRTGSTLQILDPSVSGRHAEITVDERGPLLRDLGSTNGTRVRGERVLETRLAHGDAVLFGNVELVFEDAGLSGSAPRAAPASARAADGAGAARGAEPGDTLGRVSAERVARSKRRSLLGVAVVVLLAAGGGAAWFLLGRGGGGAAARRPVVAVEGNLVEDASFEASGGGWSSDDGAAAAFLATPGARWSGDLGLEADLAAGEQALVRSDPARIAAGRTLVASARVRVDGGATALLGVEFSDEPRPAPREGAADEREGGTDAPAAPDGVTTGFGEEIADEGSGWREVSVRVPAPPGATRAALVVRATAAGDDGRVAVDDAALVQELGSSEPAAAVAEDRLWGLGEPVREALLTRVDARLVSGLRVVERDGDGPARILALAIEGLPTGARLAFDARGDAELELVVEPDLVTSGLGTVAADGFRAHGPAFERADVESLLLGAGRDVVALRFERPSTVRASARGAASAVHVRLGDARAVELQLDFGEERKAAEIVAHEARKAQQVGDLGAALERWAELLERYPYERSLVDEAAAQRSRLIEEGLARLRGVENELERARFFRLADLYRRCREDARAIGERYAPSEVEEAAERVAAAADLELAQLEGGGPPREVAELEAVLSVLERQEATDLAAELRGYIAARRAGRASGSEEAGGDAGQDDGQDDGRGGSSNR